MTPPNPQPGRPRVQAATGSAGSGLDALLAEFYRGFSGPFQPFDEGLLDYTIFEHGRATLQAFLADTAGAVGAASPSVHDFLARAAEGTLTHASLWSTEFGRLAAVGPGAAADEVVDAAIGMAWRLAADGVAGGWQGRPRCPEARIVGRWVLPVAEAACVESDRGRLRASLVLAGGGQSEMAFTRDETGALHAQPGSAVLQNAQEQGVVFLTEGVQHTRRHAYLHDCLLPAARVGEAVAAHCAAMRLMDSAAPGYAGWVRRLLRAVIPLETRSDGINSGSSRDEPGVVHASIDCPVEGYAEMLVHEVSHQHVYALARLGPLDDGSDSTLYHSPVKNTGRPIGMILLAYHAFANVVLLGRHCRGHASLGGSDYFERNEAFLRPQLATLEQGLRTSRALTPRGRALWQPLAEELAAHRP